MVQPSRWRSPSNYGHRHPLHIQMGGECDNRQEESTAAHIFLETTERGGGKKDPLSPDSFRYICVEPLLEAEPHPPSLSVVALHLPASKARLSTLSNPQSKPLACRLPSTKQPEQFESKEECWQACCWPSLPRTPPVPRTRFRKFLQINQNQNKEKFWQLLSQSYCLPDDPKTIIS